MKEIIDITLKSGKEQSVYRRHPWIFSGAIKQFSDKVTEGQLVRILDNNGRFLAKGHYQVGSIAIKIVSFDDIDIDYNFWKERIFSAFRLRQIAGITDKPDTNVYRLINAEGDNLPGLIVDLYNGTAVTQFHSVGMYLIKDQILLALQEIFGKKIKAVYDKSEGTMPFKGPIKPVNGYLWGTNETDTVIENGNQFIVDWTEGQKTGFFIDQRENRKLVQEYAHSRQMLNLFCYTGSFSIYALKGGASLVHSVDSSKSAIDLAEKNIKLNFKNNTNHEVFVSDAFDFLANIKDMYDLIILDPPAFAKHNKALDNALQGYKHLNQKAFEQIKKGGLLFTFSCSQVVSKENFRKSVFVAAANSRRKVSILHQLTQPADHPINIYHPEGEYLKGLVLLVE